MTIHGIAASALGAAQRGVEAAAEGVRRRAEPQRQDSGDTVSLSEEAAGLLRARREYETAIKLARTADEIAETTIDLLA
jgi:hypothetical protein